MKRIDRRASAFRGIGRVSCAMVAFALTGTASAQLEGDDAIVREGSGPRRDALNQLELTPFPLEHWGLISDWRIADAPTLEDMDGKVVLVMTFASWYPPSMRPLAIVNRLHRDHAEEGLVIIGLHDDEAWEEGVAAAKSRGIAFPIGRDTGNLWREAMMVDQDPDFYVIDRSGQLRFADIETSSVEAAVALLLEESREEAATLVDRLADARRRGEIEARRTARINQSADMTRIPEVPFVMPGPEAYASQRWPVLPRDPNQSMLPPGQDPPPRMMPLPKDGWVPTTPPLQGRAGVVYFFDRRVPRSVDMISRMDAVQRRYARDLVVVGVLTPLLQEQFGQPQQPVGDVAAILRSTHRAQGLAHSLIADPAQTLLNAATGQQFGGGGQRPSTLAAVVSSDGVVRWFGDASTPAFESAVDQVARVDPAVRARRAAEDDYIRQQRR